MGWKRTLGRVLPGTSWPLLAAAAVVIVLGTSAVHSLGDSDGLVEQRTRHAQTLLALEQLLATLADAESGQRGYLITGRPAYLEPYLEAGRRLTQILGELESALADQPHELEVLRRLRPIINARLSELSHTIDLRREGRTEDMLSMVGTDQGRFTMTHIRTEARKVSDRVHALLDQRDRDYIASIRRSFFVVVGGSAVLFVLTAFATMTTARELRARGEAEQAARQRGEETTAALAREQAAGRATEAARRLLDALFEAAPVGLALVDEHERFARGNATLAALTGVPENEHVGRSVGSVFPTCEPPLAEVLAGARAGQAVEREVHGEVAGGAGERFWLVRCAPADGAGLVAAFIDITERKRAESERERLVRALAKSNEDLNEFAYVASHDLKAPLRGITHVSEWLEEDLGAEIAPGIREKLQLLRGRARRLEGLIEGILNYSRAGRVGSGLVSVDVRALLKEVVDLLGAPALAAVVVRDCTWPALRTERAALEQVFMNLVSNALKHAARERSALGEPLRVEVSAEEDGSCWRFFVADNGPGIAPEYHERIWGIFQMLQARDKVEGAGIGLAIVKKIVENKGGRVWVESAVGAGAKFCFTWPRNEEELA